MKKRTKEQIKERVGKMPSQNIIFRLNIQSPHSVYDRCMINVSIQYLEKVGKEFITYLLHVQIQTNCTQSPVVLF